MIAYGPGVRRRTTGSYTTGRLYAARGVGASQYARRFRSSYNYTRGYQRGYMRNVGNYGRFQPVGPEVKFLDSGEGNAAVSTTGTLTTSLNLIPQGVSPSERVGRKVVLTAVQLRGQLSLTNTSTPTNTADRVRIILYWDKQANGAAATATDILSTASIDSFNNLTNSSRFVILADKEMELVTQAGANDGAADQFAVDVRSFSIFKRCRIPMEFNGATGGLTEIRSNNVGVMFISQSGFAGRLFTARVRFSDL